MEIDANKVIEKLMQKISQLELDNTVLKVQIDNLTAQKETKAKKEGEK